MKVLFTYLSFLLLMASFTAQAQQLNVTKNDKTAQHNAWLKQQFSEQHQNLMPIVAVADMLYSCNKERKVEPVNYKLNDLIVNMDKNRLAEKLSVCLKDDNMQSSVALNFGLLGCFHEQLSHLPEVERQQKMQLVNKAINSLSLSERKKSFTQCVSAQAMHYLQ